MDTSEKNTISSYPLRVVADRPATTAVFSGTVVGVKADKDQQIVEVQYPQGKIKFIAEGQFQTGDKVRISFPGDYAVQVFKSGSVEGSMASPAQTSGYILPATLLDILDVNPREPGVKPSLLDVFMPQARGAISSNHSALSVGQGAASWFGQVVEKTPVDSGMSTLQRLQFGSKDTGANTQSQYRYQVAVEGRNIEVFSEQSKDIGDLGRFRVESRGGRLFGHFLDPIEGIPTKLRPEFNQASPALRESMMVALQYLEEFKGEEYHEKLVKEFSQVLNQSGLMPSRSSGSPTPLPSQKDLDGLMRLFLAFPAKPGDEPSAVKGNSRIKSASLESQPKAWGDAIKNPPEMQELLKSLKPAQDSTLLRSHTNLQFALESLKLAAPNGASSPGTEALKGWLKKVLPEGFNVGELRKVAEEPGLLLATPTKDQDAGKFLLQNLMQGLPREEEMRQTKPGEFYFYQGQEWHGVKVSWQKGEQRERKGKGESQESIKLHVETKAKMLGQVQVAITLLPLDQGRGVNPGARIDFKNQFHDVRELLDAALPDLEKSLAFMDFRIASWSYALLPEPPAVPAHLGPIIQNQKGWSGDPLQLASLKERANLDLLG